jgi:hypothetical protein
MKKKRKGIIEFNPPDIDEHNPWDGDVIRVFVSGFGTVERGNRIIGALEELGFAIKVAFEPESSDCDRLIETHITPFIELEFFDEYHLLKCVAAVDEDAVVRYALYEETHSTV